MSFLFRVTLSLALLCASLVCVSAGTVTWGCCRVCPQNHLLEIDQLFGSTPPPVRRYDDAPPTRNVFLEMAAEHAARGDDSAADHNCCNICPTGQEAGVPSAPDPADVKDNPKRKGGIIAPLVNLKFSLKRVPLPPCCPYCREQHLDTAYSQIIRPQKTRSLPQLPIKDAYGNPFKGHAWQGKRRQRKKFGRYPAFLETSAEQTFKREYTYTSTTVDNCCNRCLRAPTAIEAGTAAGQDMWPVNDEKREEDIPEPEEHVSPITLQSKLAAALKQPDNDDD